MGFKKKIKEYFESRGLSNRDVSNIMDGYSESMISRYTNSDDVSITFIDKLVKYFPDLDLNYLIKDDFENNLVEESKNLYQNRSIVLINEIKENLKELESIVSRK